MENISTVFLDLLPRLLTHICITEYSLTPDFVCFTHRLGHFINVTSAGHYFLFYSIFILIVIALY